MYTESGPGRSALFLGVLLGLLLIGLALLARSCGEPPRASLRDRFIPGPTDPAQPGGISVPEPLRSAAKTTQALIGGGQAPLATPAVQSGSLEVRVAVLSPVENGIRVAGTIRNVGNEALVVPLTAFRFRDQDGRIYAAQGDAHATLAPDQSESFDLTLPTPNPQELVLTIEIPTEDIHIEMVLLSSGATPTP